MNPKIEELEDYLIRITYDSDLVFEGYNEEGLNNLLLENNITRGEFFEVFGVQTCLLVETIPPMVVYYRHDVERYLDVIIDNIPTYFD